MASVFGAFVPKIFLKIGEILRTDAKNISQILLHEFRKLFQKKPFFYALRSAMAVFIVSRYTQKSGSGTLKKGQFQQIYTEFSFCPQMYTKGIPSESDILFSGREENEFLEKVEKVSITIPHR